MIVSYTIMAPSAPNFHIHMVLYNLKELARLWNSSSLQFRPDRHVVQVDLEGPRTDELRLHGIAEEECHHAGIDLVLQHPCCPGWSVLSKEGEGVERCQNHQND